MRDGRSFDLIRGGRYEIFQAKVVEEIDLSALETCGAGSPAGRKLFDAITGKVEGTIGKDRRLPLAIPPLAGKTLIVAHD